ncbi:MAG: toll/interleukin-1 receptor domain-containing protein [Mangrovibacterium sp.]
MEGALNPYIKNVIPQKEDLFDPSSNYWFLFSSSAYFFNLVEKYKDHTTEYLFVDCSRSYPLTSDFGFLKELISKIMISNYLVCYNFFTDLEKIWTKLKDPEKNEFELRTMIYDFFLKIEFINKVIIIILSDIHLLEDKIQDKEIHILNKISCAINTIKLWVVSDSKMESKSSKLRKEFFNSFRVANDIQKDTFFRCTRCIDRKEFKRTDMDKIKLFISYAHADELYKNGLAELLKELKIGGLIEEWNDQYLIPGREWDEQIKRKLYESQIILFLVSKNFFKSDYIKDVEIKNTLNQYEQNGVLIISILLDDCDFKETPLSKFYSLPKELKPLNEWSPEITAWNNIIDGLKRAIYDLKKDESEFSCGIQKAINPATINQGGQNNVNIVNNTGSINISRDSM